MTRSDRPLPPPPPGRHGWPWDDDPDPSQTEDRARQDWGRLTIVTPSFQQGAFLEETIRSVLRQGYPNLEYFVIDGGSSDETMDILRKYEPWLAGWVSEKDRGQGHALNKGFARATGNVLAWINSDDIYLPGAFFEAVRVIQRTGGRSPVFGGCVSIDGGVRTQDVWTARYLGRTELIRFWQRQHQFREDGWFISQPAVFFPRETYRRAGPLDESLYLALDYDLWLRMSANAEFVPIPAVLAGFRLHPASKSVMAEDWMHDALIASRRYWGRRDSAAYWGHRWSYERWRRGPRAHESLVAAEAAMREGGRLSALGHALTGLARWPPAISWPHTPSLLARIGLPRRAVGAVRRIKRERT